MQLEKSIEILKYELDKSKVCKKYQTHTIEFLKDLDDYIEAIQTVLKELNRKDRIINSLKIALKERTNERDRKDDQMSKLRAVTTKQEKMIHEAYAKANNYLYFNDSSDYEAGLWEVIRSLRSDLAEKWDNGDCEPLKYIEEEAE